MKTGSVLNRIKNKMIRPTTIPQTLEELIIEQALAREALRLSFIQHKEFAVSLKGIQQERTISDTFDQKIPKNIIGTLPKINNGNVIHFVMLKLNTNSPPKCK